MKVETITLDNVECNIYHDEDGHWLYDELFEGDVSFISNHRDYESKGEHQDIENLPEGYESVQVTGYIHSSISLSLGSFDCPWDSGVFGHLIFKSGEFGENNQGLKSFVQYWEDILNGCVYFFEIDRDDADILGGIVGFDNALEEAQAALKHYVDTKNKDRVDRLKKLIVNRVPLNKRSLILKSA